MNRKIAIVGESCIDEYVYGSCDRVCPEASALCFKSSGYKTTNPGMAGNVYENIKVLNKYKDDITLITSELPIIKRRFIDKKYNTIVFREDIGDTCPPIDIDKYDFSIFDCIIFSDYCKGFLSDNDIIKICQCKNKECITFIDTKKNLLSCSNYIDFIKINNLEFRQNYNHLDEIISKTKLIVTEGEDGATFYSEQSIKKYPTNKVLLRDVCGAGDTFLASLAINYLHTKNIDDSITFANQCSAQVVAKFGVTTV
jgi:D-beta-D-heptose 7-phosphate kinase/D-beta-D-heptose 1-phosphate adenosyltransferase